MKRDVAPKAESDTKAKPSTTGQASEQKAAPGCEVGRGRQGRPGWTVQRQRQGGSGSQGSSAQGPHAGSGQFRGRRVKPPSGQTGSFGRSLTTEQKTKIRTTVLQSSSAPKVSRSSINFNISVGTVVPRTVQFVAVPATIVEIHPAWRGYSYFIVDEEIIIVEPSTLKIVAVLVV